MSKSCTLPAPNPRLALAIPTYNRASVLIENLRRMLPELIEFGISVYISDDSTNSYTADAVAELLSDYPFIFYRHNNPRLGHDDNFYSTVAMPTQDYVWYLGDSVLVKEGGFRDVLERLSSNPDFCFVNSYVKSLQDLHLEPDQMHGFLLQHAWYLTLSGATIYGRKSRALPVCESRKLQWRNFPQLGLILEYCSLNSARCEWLASPLIEINQNKKSYWAKQAFSVFVKDWSALIRSFPSLFNKQEADAVIRSHSNGTGIFGVLGLIRLRSMGALNNNSLLENEQDFIVASGYVRWARFLCSLPTKLCYLAVSLGKASNQVVQYIRRAK